MQKMRGFLKGVAAIPCLMLKAGWHLGWWQGASSSVSVLGERSVPCEPSAGSDEPAQSAWELLCVWDHTADLGVSRSRAWSTELEHRAGAQCDLSTGWQWLQAEMNGR